MTDSLEARRAALVENLTRLGYTQTDRVEYGQWWDGATSDGGVLVLNADKLDSPDADHTMVRAERYIAPLLAIEAAAFARGVESRPPVDVEAALDEWLADEDCWPEHDEFGALTGAVASDREGLLDLLRTVTAPSEPLTLAQLEALPVGSVVLDDRELSWQTDESGMWTRLDWRCTSGDMLITFGPVRLLHTGTATTRGD